MIEGVPIAGVFALACTLQDVDPLLGTPVSEPHAASLVARDGNGVFIGWEDVRGQARVSVRKLPDGNVLLTGLKFKNSADETWAVLEPTKIVMRYTIEWLTYDHQAADGRRTAATWSKGHCDLLGGNSLDDAPPP